MVRFIFLLQASSLGFFCDAFSTSYGAAGWKARFHQPTPFIRSHAAKSPSGALFSSSFEDESTIFNITAEVERISSPTITAPLPLKEPATLNAMLPLMPEEDLSEEQLEMDEKYMQMAIEVALLAFDANGRGLAYPNPTVGAILVARDGRILGKGYSDYKTQAVPAVLRDAGLEITPLSEWCVGMPSPASLRDDLAGSTLYVTLEPSFERKGTANPPITQLIQEVGIPRIVIGCADPVPERATLGAAALHTMGLQVSLGRVLPDECNQLIEEYSALANNKLHRMAQKHFQLFRRPLGFLHCSVIASDDVEAFARQGNAFGTSFGSTRLSFRDFGSYEIAPPPELIWVEEEDGMNGDLDPLDDVDFEDEDYQGDIMNNASPMTPYYEQVDAVVATFPRAENGPPEDKSVIARLKGLAWLATHGRALPAGVERILVMDATDLGDLPLRNGSDNLPPGPGGVPVDVESFWRGEGRKPTRLLLRRGTNAQARAAADAAVAAAQAAAEAAVRAKLSLESGEAADAAEAAAEHARVATAEAATIRGQVQRTQAIRRSLEEMGVIVETLQGGEPVDIMRHLGTRHGMHTVVWRAGCWGERGVRAILEGAFQWVSAHLAVDAVGGKFWQLMLAENAVQAACGPVSKVKVFAEQEDISLEYCDQPDADNDCNVAFNGRPVRHIRLDCRIALVDEERPREFVIPATKKIDKRHFELEAPWFL